MNRLFSRTCAAVGAAALMVAGGTTAVADNLHADDAVAGAGISDITLVGGTASTEINFRINANGGDGCNATVGSPGTLTVAITGGTAGGMTASPSSLVFTECQVGSDKNEQPMTFTATQPGVYTVTTSVADPNPGNGYGALAFTITVNGPANTKPTVAVTGVSATSYELGAVPVAGCQVTDTEDGSSTKPAGLSAISGPLAAYGIGDQTATCTHTDTGGLGATPASVTYQVVDTTAPALVGMPAGQVLEAADASGAVATWTDPTATDLGGVAGGPSCSPASGSTFPLGTTDVTCSATDHAGNTGSASFAITVQDTTDPVISGGAGTTLEATGQLTPATYTEPTATDTVDASVPVDCVPPSGSEFPVGTTTVTCTATDDAGNDSSVELAVVITDLTAPAITAPDVQGVEATGPDGAAVSFAPTASDLVDGDRPVLCDHESGDTFPLGTTPVHCSSQDTRGNTSYASFTVEVVDTTAPEITVPGDRTVEATGPDGAVVDFAGDVSATDTVDTDVQVSCIPPSGSTFGLGGQPVTCTATDDAGNTDEGTFVVTVVDTTAPVVNAPTVTPVEATGPDGAVVEFEASADDIVDTDVDATCSPASGATFPLGSTPVTCTATDDSANTGTATFTIEVVDTTAPALTLPGNIALTATSAAGAVATYTAAAEDLVDGSVTPSCSPASGSTFPVGTTTVSCTAGDSRDNTAAGSFTVTVSYAWNGFFQPIDNTPTGGAVVFNKAKAGQSIPAKFSLGGNMGLNVIAAGYPKVTQVACSSSAADLIEVYAASTANNGLTYDATADQYNYVWKTQSAWAGSCRKFELRLVDGSVHVAYFSFTK